MDGRDRIAPHRPHRAHRFGRADRPRQRQRPGLILTALASMATCLAVAGAAQVASATPLPTAAATKRTHTRTLSYPLEQVWPAALRYLRVDRGFALVDRDKEAGYILFDIPLSRDGESELSGRGSLEMVATEDAAGRPSVSLVVSADAGPSYLPHAIGEGLAAKMKSERGQPAPPPKADPEPVEPPDEGGGPPMLPPAVDPEDL